MTRINNYYNKSLKNLIVYQFGDFVFNHTNLTQAENSGIKTLIDENPYLNGKVKTNQFNQDYKDDTTYEINFKLSQKQDIHQLKQQVLYSKPQKVFFLEEVDTNIIQDTPKDYNVYFNYGHIIGLSAIEDSNRFRVVIRLMNPYKYLIEDLGLRFIEFTDLKNLNLWGATFTGNWGVNDYGNWGDNYSSQSQFNFNSVTPKQRVELIDCCNPKGFFDYSDLFFRHERSISSTIDKIQTIALSGTQGQTADVLTQLSLNQKTTSKNKTVIFVIESSNSQALTAGQEITLINSSNSQNVKIRANTNKCPASLLVLPYRSNWLFNSLFNPIDYFTNSDFTITTNGIEDSIFFEGFYPVNYQDTLIINRNFSGNLTVKILLLPTFE